MFSYSIEIIVFIDALSFQVGKANVCQSVGLEAQKWKSNSKRYIERDDVYLTRRSSHVANSLK